MLNKKLEATGKMSGVYNLICRQSMDQFNSNKMSTKEFCDHQELNYKLYMERQNTQNSSRIQKKKNKVKGQRLSNFRTYYGGTILKSV
jgi:hypothetical protein